MKVILIADDAPDDQRELEWPSDYRIPVRGEQLMIPDLDKLLREVSGIRWVLIKRGPSMFFEAQIWVYGPAFDASPGS